MNNKAFTLVEILIVVIILGILAAIVIPQFTQASNDARESALASDLQMVRSQLELYKVQHLEEYPDHVDTVTDVDEWIANLTAGTDGAGADGSVYGPYMQKFPENPFITTVNTLLVDFGTGTSTADGDNSSHWFHNTSNGKFSPNDSKGDSGDLHKTW